jgi:hypothetical protein
MYAYFRFRKERMKYSMTVLLLVSLSASAQSKPDKTMDVVGLEPYTVTSPTAFINPPTARWSDKITKDGHYVATMDDPNNEYRCDIASYVETNPRNAFGSEVTSFTVVCTKKRDPQPDK